MNDDELLTREATQRIASSRTRQLAFRLKQVAPALSDGDAESLAIALLEADEAHNGKIDSEDVQARLRNLGRSPDAARRIAKAIGL